MSNLITGLDIGSSLVKGLVVERKKDGTLYLISAFKHPSCGFRKGVLVDVEDVSRMFEDLINELRQISKAAVKNVFLNINSEYIKVRISKGISAVGQPDKEIKQDDIDRAVQAAKAAKSLPNYKILHTIIREFLVDDVGDIQNPLDMTGSRIEVSTLLVEAFAPHLDLLFNTFQNSGAGIGGVVFNPLACARAVLSKKQKELGVLMLDLGFGTSSIAIFDENKPLYAKSFSVGSGHITNDIACGFKIPVDTAEKLKIAFGAVHSDLPNRKITIKLSEINPDYHNEISKRFLAEIIQTRVAEIIDIINNDIKPLRHKFQFPGGLVITGGGIKLQGIADFFRQKMNLPVQIGMPSLREFEITNPTYETLIDDPQFSTAVGLVFAAKDETEKKSSSMFGFLKRIFKSFIP